MQWFEISQNALNIVNVLLLYYLKNGCIVSGLS